ncbi:MULTISPECIES: endolytic transglycosylase MltG [unclassified Beijerinckia]|uniref:endolytic transglycosylase MltG n=1 Tax=unclassified Beijerinckia TaxID=2638183 RepID=UPI000897BC33|nr:MULTISPECIES: endolytic transglycosylase MltG [unclassified Beijerinckia]MDH7795715.1 UPF0755 protein [Beijerinckia sp. GAS462]SEC13064.1 UPF0755 protein [Beijerinckia sp. 28-YEA-48]
MSEGQPTENGAGEQPERERARFFGRRRGLQTPSEALQPEAAPPPPEGKPQSQRRPILSRMSGFLSFLLLVSLIGIGGMASISKRLETPGPLEVDRAVYIPPRSEVREIIDQLEKANVIEQPTLMQAALLVERKWRDVKAGEYLFPQRVSLQQVIDILVSGKQILHSITVPEGLTSEQIVQRLRDNDVLAGDIRDIPREGTIMPDTYRVTRGMLRSVLLAKMQSDQNRLLDQIWDRRATDLPLKSKYELVTLASIVEKETGRADERTRVAAVFHNRLQRRMKLQSDPTIVYGIVGGKGTLGRPIQRNEITRPTPFNTYVIDGLPPGPIANPGRAAMEAVANPSKTRDLFFVANGSGGHAFAETLDQHNRNVARWREIERDMKTKVAPGATPPADVDRVDPDDSTTTTEMPLTPVRPVPARRSDLPQDPIFGGLSVAAIPAPKSSMEAGPVVSLMPPSDARGARNQRQQAARQPAPPPVVEQPAPQQAAALPAGTSAFSGFAMGQGLDQLVIRGVNDAPSASLLDGPVDEPAGAGSADMTVVPLSAARRADQEARMARFGQPTDAPTLVNNPEDVQETPPLRTAPMRARAFDASEGTKLDPLRNTSWDLNSAKTVPAMKTVP